jgi:hypothetical protein
MIPTMSSTSIVRRPVFRGGARGGAFAGAFGGARIAGAPVLVAGRIAVWLAAGAAFGVAAAAGRGVVATGLGAVPTGAVAGLGAVPIGEVAGDEFGVLVTLVLGVPISLSVSAVTA